MSVALMAAAWALKASSTDKIVLLALADHANDDGKCWPGNSSLTVKCGLSERAVRMALRSLEMSGHITCNFVLGKSTTYHVHPGRKCPRQEMPPAPRAETPAPRAPKSSRTIIDSYSEGAKPKTNAAFAAFWTAYPRRTGKLAAEKAHAAAIKRGVNPQHIAAAAQRYADDPPDDPKFIPHPATWLNRGSYDDEPMEGLDATRNGPMGGTGPARQPRPGVDRAGTPRQQAVAQIRAELAAAGYGGSH